MNEVVQIRYRFFACDCEKRKMYWMYIEFFGKKQAGKDVPKMCRRINQRFLKRMILCPASCGASLRSEEIALPAGFLHIPFPEFLHVLKEPMRPRADGSLDSLEDELGRIGGQRHH